MARFTLKTRNHGELSFFVVDTGGYVRLESGRNHGTLGKQICHGGGYRGTAVTATADTLADEARRWWRQSLRSERNA